MASTIRCQILAEFIQFRFTRQRQPASESGFNFSIHSLVNPRMELQAATSDGSSRRRNLFRSVDAGVRVTEPPTSRSSRAISNNSFQSSRGLLLPESLGARISRQSVTAASSLRMTGFQNRTRAELIALGCSMAVPCRLCRLDGEMNHRSFGAFGP